MKILYVRSGPYELNPDSYNLQEVGLAKALCKKGFDVDILYYSKTNKNQTFNCDNHTVCILWRKGIKLFRSGIYPSILRKSFLNQYDYIIASEYSQIMSILLTFFNKPVYIYNGPYYNLFKIPFMEIIYDKLFCNYINKKVKLVFCKTKMSEQYLHKKHIYNTKVIGVGLDNEKIDSIETINSLTKNIVNQLDNHINFLFVGSITKRKNVSFLFEVFNKLKLKYPDFPLQLVIIGKGDSSYLKYCFSLLNKDVNSSVIYVDFVENTQLKYIYQATDIFLLASTKEIFGMVLLEAMYNKVLPISSYNAGSNTLIKNDYNGYIVEDFNVDKWISCIEKVLLNNDKSIIMRKNAFNTIQTYYLWDKIADRIINELNL